MKDTKNTIKSTTALTDNDIQSKKSPLASQNTAQSPQSLVIFGAESSGKTTLAKHLANTYKVFWNPEYARLYLDTKMTYGLAQDTNDLTYTDAEAIAIAQYNSEKQVHYWATTQQHPFYILDTNLLSTFVYCKYIYRKVPEWLKKAIKAQHYSYYLLIAPNIAWEYSPQRSSAENRMFFFQKMKHTLDILKIEYELIDTVDQARIEQTTMYLNKFGLLS